MINKKIETLVEDIEGVLVKGLEDNENSRSIVDRFGSWLSKSIAARLIRNERKPELRMSNIGKPCERQLWYEVNQPELGEPLRAETYMKFLFGDIIEELLLFLAELAGHEVTGRQDEQEIEGIKGHRDAVVDGTVVDVKSASTYSFKKFKEGTLKENDSFGYIPQLQSYLSAGQTDDTVTEKSKAAFIVLDKTIGHITLDVHEKDEVNWSDIYKAKKEVIADKDNLPPRGFSDEPFGQSGNMKLGINCSYCPFKKTCWPEARTFLYSTGPITLTKVELEPRVPELTE